MGKINTLIRSDHFRYYGKKSNIIVIYLYGILCINHCFSYSFWLRLCSISKIKFVAKYMHRKLSRKYGIQIPYTTKIGYGFYIGHGCGVIVNPTTIIGNNCNISQFVTIGSNHGKAAKIGDNVYIGPSVCIVENVIIGDNASIGAGAVVVKDIADNITVAGVPAKPIEARITPGQYITKRWI